METFSEYIEWCNGIGNAAKRLQVSRSYLYHVQNGDRPITKSLAEKIHADSNGTFDRAKILWGKT